ncbi:DNA-binding response regulator [Nocardia sp. XZ_19_369]|uniref:helix-turn-helix transcriptional regulator n=1 Tax=Nocardia sp. XZ_19_369 TaxID=2769487 RepID=UPI001890222C|nr:DNA-binding response regulator [Nocardia sp. XZ_19_369]
MNAVQLCRDTEEVTRSNAFVHPSLREYMDPTNGPCGTLFAASFRLEFADYDQLAARRDVDSAPIVLPVNTEYQAESLRSIRAAHAMGLIVAVTNDVTGHATYFAIRAGANFVINIAIAVERQAEILRAHLFDRADKPSPSVFGTVPNRGVNSPRPEPTRAREVTPAVGRVPRSSTPDRRPELNEFDARLLRMLRTSMTVAEIARHNYLSERSMYRRIRALYNTLGVRNRAELAESRAAARPPMTVLHS